MKEYIPPTGKHFDYPDCYPWRETFAFWPVRTVGGRWVWLKKVYKQKYYTAIGQPWQNNFRMNWFVEYGELFDVLIS